MWLRVIAASPEFPGSRCNQIWPVAHVSPLLHSLHWLPIKFRIAFKLTLLALKTLKKGQPSNICNLLSRASPSRTPRSNQGILLKVLGVKTATGSRAFSFPPPHRLWNFLRLLLQYQVSTPLFKKKLKTHLFDISCPLRDFSFGSLVVDWKRQRSYRRRTWNG